MPVIRKTAAMDAAALLFTFHFLQEGVHPDISMRRARLIGRAFRAFSEPQDLCRMLAKDLKFPQN